MVWAIPFIVMSNNWRYCRIMTNQKKDTIWTHWGTHKLHYRSLENAYRGVGLRRKMSKNADRLGYLFHSHTAYPPLILHLSTTYSPPIPRYLPPTPMPPSALPIPLHNHTPRPSNTTATNISRILITQAIEPLPINPPEYHYSPECQIQLYIHLTLVQLPKTP